MKNFLLLIISVFAVAAQAAGECIDQRAVLLAPCSSEGERHVFDRGQCEKSYEFVSVTCKQPEGEITVTGNAQVIPSMIEMAEVYMTGVELVNVDPVFTKKEVEQFLDSGDLVFYYNNIENSEVKSCDRAQVTLKVGRGNISPNLDGTESYTSPSLVSFDCLDEEGDAEEGVDGWKL